MIFVQDRVVIPQCIKQETISNPTPFLGHRTVSQESPGIFTKIRNAIANLFQAIASLFTKQKPSESFPLQEREILNLSSDAEEGKITPIATQALSGENTEHAALTDIDSQANVSSPTPQMTSVDLEKPFQIELKKVTPQQEEALKAIMRAGADKSTSWTAGLYLTKTVISNYPAISNLHPLILCALIFSDKEMSEHYHTISQFSQETDGKLPLLTSRIGALQEAQAILNAHTDLSDLLPGFCAKMGIKPQFVNASLGAWELLFDELYLIASGQKPRFVPEQAATISLESSKQPEAPVQETKEEEESLREETSSDKVRDAFLSTIGTDGQEAIQAISKATIPSSIHWEKLLSCENDPTAVMVTCFENPAFLEKFQKKEGFSPMHDARRVLTINFMANCLSKMDTRKTFAELTSKKDWETFLKHLSTNPGKIEEHRNWVKIAQEVTVGLKRS